MRKNDPKEYPKTYLAQTGGSIKPAGEIIFDPALRQFPRAFRPAAPQFDSPEEKARWRQARWTVIGHLLRIVGESPCRDSLVLRGSLLLKTWLTGVAREPGDIDWVVRPVTAGITDPTATRMFDDLIRAAQNQRIISDIAILGDRIAVDDIWTYERVPGKRIVFPWRADGLPDGAVQMDFVFGEILHTAPSLMPIVIDGNAVSVWAATPEESLAWKLLWLETDGFPQGKDLYDAVLLAERTYLPWNLLHKVLSADDWFRSNGQNKELFELGDLEWDDFKREHPDIEGDAFHWQKRLRTALARTLAERDAASL
ncbi:MAG: nucleotidyl transferase AbiEii/AbiGii toxin family protein [Akkermansiaceae bacterium]|nr:nucleotidyl transferase AbiEii/AbiGii toxin family protein [Armatimonadota bacterium]